MQAKELFEIQDQLYTQTGISNYLTDREQEILWYLLSNANVIKSKYDIIKGVWCTEENTTPDYYNDGIIKANMSRLRAHIKDAGYENFIRTVRGFGYVIEVDSVKKD